MVALPKGESITPIDFLTDEQIVSGVGSAMPRIPDRLLDGIVFLYQTKEQAANNARIGGTAFLLSRVGPRASEAMGQSVAIPFLVSNKHVVFNGGASVPRFNRSDGGGSVIDFDPIDWTAHPEGDDLVAVCVFGLIDRVQEKITSASHGLLITEQIAEAAEIGIGDEVFMLGRFINHQGRDTIRPAVRFGNISMGPEPIWNNATGHNQLSYAVEMRSRTGFSGAPVMVYRVPGSSLVELPKGSEDCWGILGVNWGHILDENGENTWLNGVVPAWKVIELLEEPALKAAFEQADQAASESNDKSVVPSVAAVEAEPPTTADNPSHKEDFSRLLTSVATRKSQGDQT